MTTAEPAHAEQAVPPAFGQVWQLGDQLALVIYIGDPPPTRDDGSRTAHCRPIVDGRAGGTVFVADVVDGRLVTADGTWSMQSVVPMLRCLDHRSARAARDFLAGKGIRDAVVSGNDVAAPLTPPSVLSFAEDAFEQGWADDPECAAMIARLG